MRHQPQPHPRQGLTQQTKQPIRDGRQRPSLIHVLSQTAKGLHGAKVCTADRINIWRVAMRQIRVSNVLLLRCTA
jgi:hypothetical protein